ncbi:MAG: hypothetical protein GXP49_02365 [Deltaproteobacteria bacterium]|nr:hypothetical protein [Deltaproteobacteria bacterium]
MDKRGLMSVMFVVPLVFQASCSSSGTKQETREQEKISEQEIDAWIDGKEKTQDAMDIVDSMENENEQSIDGDSADREFKAERETAERHDLLERDGPAESKYDAEPEALHEEETSLACPDKPGYFGGITVFDARDLFETKKAANLGAGFAVKPVNPKERKPAWSNNECKAFLNLDITPPDQIDPVDTLDAGRITVKVKDRELFLDRVWSDEHGFFYYKSPLDQKNETLFSEGDLISVDNGQGGTEIGRFSGATTGPKKPEPFLPPPLGSFCNNPERSQPLEISWKEGGSEKIYVNFFAYTKDAQDKVKDTLGIYCVLSDKGCGFLKKCSYTIPREAMDLVPDPVDGMYLTLARTNTDDISNCWSDSALVVTSLVVQSVSFAQPDGE